MTGEKGDVVSHEPAIGETQPALCSTAATQAPAEMPGVEEIARALIAHFVENTGFTTVEEDETKTRVSAYYGGVWVELRVYPMARAVLDLFAPILAEKEREIATFDSREAEWNEAIANSLQNEEDAHRKLEDAEAALAAERERCVAIVDAQVPDWVKERSGPYWEGYRDAMEDAAEDMRKGSAPRAAAIRAQGE